MRFALFGFFGVVVLAVASSLAPTPVPEAWVRVVLPVWASFTARLFEVSPVSVTLVAAGAIVLALIVGIAWAPRGRRVRRSFVLLVGTTAVLGGSFVLTWGSAYHRLTLARALDLPPEGADLRMLEAAFDRLLQDVHDHAPERPLHTFDARERADAARNAARCVADADEVIVGRRIAVPGGVRELPAGALLRAGYGGIALPWLLEPHVDAGLPGAAWLAVAIHELTHTALWAREADTEALSLLAGLACDDRDVRYATALHGAAVVGAAIATITEPGHTARMRVSQGLADMPEVARADRRALATSVAHFHHSATADSIGRVYDAYLRSQGVEAGIADYALAGGILASALAACPTVRRPWCD